MAWSGSLLTYMERMGATESRDAMMMPISQMLAVSSRAHVGSPLALPCPNTCSGTKRKREGNGRVHAAAAAAV